VIKNNSKALKKMPDNLRPADSIVGLKLIGFNDQNYTIDSLLKGISSLRHVRYIIFENCDLSALETSFVNFRQLEKISILKESVLDENSFFPLLKDTKIQELCIKTDNPDISMDSVYLVPHLKSLSISSSTLFGKPNHTTSFQLKKQDSTLQTINVAYFGSFYKSNQTGVKTNTPVSKPPTQTAYSTNFQSKLDCIKQPIPGIRINDTSYTLNPSQQTHFTYKSGTQLTIDRNAFLNQNGSPYSGSVKLFYREFRNPVEIMLSGIPMTNKVNGEEHLFKSGGMYELNAFDVNNKPLNLVSDTSIKINFVLTDTSNSFQYFSLNNNGSWTTVSQDIKIVNTTSTSNTNNSSRAVKEYYLFMNVDAKERADTTSFNDRFYSKDYVYTYRKDNFSTMNTSEDKNGEKKKEMRHTANFRVKFYRLTKDKQIVFTIVPATRSTFAPAYMSQLFNKKYLYQGELTKEQFRKIYHRKKLFWDVRATNSEDVITLDMKSDAENQIISGQIITLKDNKDYIVHKKSGKVTVQKIVRLINRNAKDFNKDERKLYWNRNNLNHYVSSNKEPLAYEHCKKFQTAKEKTMTHSEWLKYAAFMNQRFNSFGGVSQDNELGNALLKSGLGFKNIDCYLHSGQMEDILVYYPKANNDSLASEFHTFLYKTINTSYPIYNTATNSVKLKGYYFKNKPNYIIRFSNNGIMQVIKPATVLENKRSNVITLDYVNQFNVKGMDSDAITKLILD
jgi:hypothetical protein